MAKKWEIAFQLEQHEGDGTYDDRVKNYRKILGLMGELRDVLVTKGMPLGFSIVDRSSGVKEGGENPL